jgi:hypothetical protein
LTSAGFRVIISAISTIAIQAEFFASFHKSEAELFGVTDMRSIGLTLALLFIAESAWAQVRDQQPIPAPKIEMGADGVKLAMGSSGGRASVEARVNGEGPYRFFFDTGASGPVISQKLARQLKLDVIGEAGVKSGGDAPDKRPIAAQIVRMDRLELGAAKLSDVSIVAMDRSRLRKDQDAPEGVLSPAMFPGYLVTLDYPKKEIRIRSGELGTPDGKTVFGYIDGRTIPSLLATIGDRTIEAHLDSGSPAGLSLPTKVAGTLTLDGKPIDTGKKARSVSGEFPVLEGKLKGKLSFGQFSFNDPTIEFSDVVRRANLGTRILERFVVTLDVKNRRFRIVEGL